MARLALDHVALPIFDVAASLDFYLNTLGLPLVDALSGDDWGKRAWLTMSFALPDQRQLVLVALRGAKPEHSVLPADAHHVALAVEDLATLDEWKQRLADAHVSYSEEEHDSQRSLYFKDPNGIVLELTTPPATRAYSQTNGLRAREVVERFISGA